MQPVSIKPEHSAFADDVLHGLRQKQKSIPSQYFYDARGSDLFEEITDLEEYYPTRTEIGILKAHIPAFASDMPPRSTLIEFGSGSSIKTEILLDVMPDLTAYVAIDVSPSALNEAQARLQQQHPDLTVLTVVGSFFDPVTLPGNISDTPKLGFFPGSTIGNFTPTVAGRLLTSFRTMLGTQGRLIIGVDLQKSADRLIAAYDDAKGVTADFNMNLLTRINRELSGTFELDQFEHEARYNTEAGRIEMHLISQSDQSVSVAGQSFDFQAGESIHTENSHKYTLDGFADLAASAGWQIEETWSDNEDLFSVHVLAS